MSQDILQEAKECYEDAKEDMREQHNRIREDFRFSNPAAPEQWDEWAKTNRKGRPMHTLDRTNQYIQHVVNKNRERKSSAEVFAVDGGADVEVAKLIKGMFRHIEYVSRADIAWAMAADHQARGGLGWVRVIPKVIDSRMNWQDLVIQRITDPTSCHLEAGWQEPDGSDAKKAWVETTWTHKAFQKKYPKAKLESWSSDGWFSDKSVRVCEYYKVLEKTTKKLIVSVPCPEPVFLTEDEYWAESQRMGFHLPLQMDAEGKPETFESTLKTVKCLLMTGFDVLEESEYQCQWIGLIPVLGHELFLDGKRYFCGMVRRLMDGQRLHNYEMSALTEALMVQPKAPLMVPAEGLEGWEDDWQAMNRGNPTHLPYNHRDETGQPIPAPIRLMPPNFPVAYANTANLAVQEMEASVGLYKSNLGQQSNAISGRAKAVDVDAGETATYHFSDNLRIAREHCYRVILDWMPSIYTGRRIARIMGDDDKQGQIIVDSTMQAPMEKEDGKVTAINLGVGTYDVRVKIGPSYTTIREELGVKLQELGKGNPVLASALLPVLMKMSDMPEADKIARVAMAMLPPEVQKAYSEEESGQMPAEARAAIMQKDQELQQATQALDQAGKIIEDLHGKANDKGMEIKASAESAKSEIESKIQALNAQQETLLAREKQLKDATRIAMLELQLAQEKAMNAVMSAKPEVGEQAEPQEDTHAQAMNMMMQAIQSGQQTLAQAIADNAAKTAEMQAMTAEAMDNMAQAMSAPRQINLQRDSEGRPQGATSMIQ